MVKKIDEGRQAYVVAPHVGPRDAAPASELEGDDSQGPNPLANIAADAAALDEGERSASEPPASEPPDPAQPLRPTDRDDLAEEAKQQELDQVAVEVANVQSVFLELSRGPLRNLRLDILHGGLTAADKDAAMQRFEQGLTQVLIASAVVEVGLDVPNATLMTIQSAERFGLAALHQLRGRVARGAHPGYVALFDHATTEASQQRLEALLKSTDGFELAEWDYQLRGPGDLFGVQQHGLPPLRVADLHRDQAWLQEAFDDARQLLQTTHQYQDPAWRGFKEMVLRRYGNALELGDLG